MIHPPGEDIEDAERWWQAYLLAEDDQAGELRERSAAGDEHARRQLASWLADRARTQEAIEVIRPLADAGDDVAELWLARWLADGDQLDELRQRAGAGGYGWLRIWEMTTPGNAWSGRWPGCASAPKPETTMPGDFWPSGRTDHNEMS